MSDNLLLPEIGVETFGDITQDAEGNLLSHAQVIRNVIAEGQAAEAANLDFFGVGEHHRDDYRPGRTGQHHRTDQARNRGDRTFQR